MRLYLDEMFGPMIASLLRARGGDAVSALELGHVSVPDETHLVLAAQEGRCVVTRDYAGVLLVSPSLSRRDFGPLVEALAHFTQEHPDGLVPYSILWLQPAPSA